MSEKALLDLCMSAYIEYSSNSQEPQKDVGENEVFQDIREWLRDNRANTVAMKKAATCTQTMFHLTPILLVCQIRPTCKDVVETLIQAAPAMVAKCDSLGWLPLHHACFTGAAVDILQLLIDAYPPGLVQTDRNGETPAIKLKSAAAKLDRGLYYYLHQACFNPYVSHGMLHLLIDALPESLGLTDDLDRTPVQILKESKAAQQKDTFGCLLIHHACRDGNYVEVQFLLEAYREGITQRDSNGLLPLHYACTNDAISLDMVIFLLDAYPESVVQTDDTGRLPFHHACANASISLDILKILVHAFPECITQIDTNGMLPFHHACTNGAVSYDVLIFLLVAYPECIDTSDNLGRTPLQLLKESKAAEYEHNNGFLLLHRACMDGASNKILQLLVDAYPDGCRKKDHRGKQPWQLLKENGWVAQRTTFPLHRACRDGASLHLLKLLLDACPDNTDKRDDNGKTPADLLKESGRAEQPDRNHHMLLLHCACSADFCNEGPTKHMEKFLHLIIDAYPDGRKARDKKGMTPLHHACVNANSKEVLKLLVSLLVVEENNNMKGKKGRTALHFLLERLNGTSNFNSVVNLLLDSGVVECLIEHGADANAEDVESRTPLSYVEELLKEKYARKIPLRLQLYLQLKPFPNTKFYCLLEMLPVQERKEAVLHGYVQEKLNEAVCKRFPTLILMLDFYCIVIVIVCYGVAMPRYSKYLFGNDTELYQASHAPPAILLLCGGLYWLIMDVLLIASLTSIGLFKAWWSDPRYWLDVGNILIVFCSASIILTNAINNESSEGWKEAFRSLSAVCSGFLFMSVFSFLKRIFLDFAVFAKGVLVVFWHLITFLMALSIMITAFALMFYMAFSGSIYCSQCEIMDCSQFCGYWSSWFEVYNLIFQMQPTEIFVTNSFESNSSRATSNSMRFVAYVLYFLLGIIVVIVLFNVLIAIVWDSYSNVRNKNSEELFWSSRLKFVFEVSVISSRFPSSCGFFNSSLSNGSWTYSTKDKRPKNDEGIRAKFLPPVIPQLVAFLFGFASAGLLWPLEIRKLVWGHSQKKDTDSTNNILREIKATVIEVKKEACNTMKTEAVVAEISQMLLVVEGKLMAELATMKETQKYDMERMKNEIIHQMTDQLRIRRTPVENG